MHEACRGLRGALAACACMLRRHGAVADAGWMASRRTANSARLMAGSLRPDWSEGQAMPELSDVSGPYMRTLPKHPVRRVQHAVSEHARVPGDTVCMHTMQSAGMRVPEVKGMMGATSQCCLPAREPCCCMHACRALAAVRHSYAWHLLANELSHAP